MKKALLASLCAMFCVKGILWYHSPLPRQANLRVNYLASVAAASKTNLPPVLAKFTPAQSVSLEMDLAVNPYAGGLREPGKSRRGWHNGFIGSFQMTKSGDPMQFELTGGVVAQGSVKIIQNDGGQVTYVSGVTVIRSWRMLAVVKVVTASTCTKKLM
jgi:hypothetical protein